MRFRPGLYYSLARKIWLSNTGGLENPFKLTYVVTKECHSRCENCSIWKTRPQNELTLDEIRRLAENSPFLSWIDFTGGEPTDRRDFADLVQVFAKNCPNLLLVHFPTNGLKPKRVVQACQRIRSVQADFRLVVSVSIDGPPEINDKLRGVPGDFDRAVDTFRQLSGIDGVEVYAGMTLYPDNLQLIDQTVQAIANRLPGFSHRQLHVNIGHISPHYYANDQTDAGAAPAMAAALAALQKRRGIPLNPFAWVEQVYHRRAADYLSTQRTPLPCAALLSSCFLAESGAVFPCSIWDAPLGNIRETGYSLLPLLHSQRGHSLRCSVRDEKCPHCWTPCEAYPTILANLLNGFVRRLYPKRPGN